MLLQVLKIKGHRRLLAAGVLAGVLVGMSHPVRADLRLPALFSDHMVLQSGKIDPVWGWADPGQEVVARIAGGEVHTHADKDGRWRLLLSPMKPARNQVLKITAGTETVRITDVCIGEVWLCAGQSNMEMPLDQTGVMKGVVNYPREILNANYPDIRFFHVPRTRSDVPSDVVDTEWIGCRPGSAQTFSATAYFFGRELHKSLNQPVGLIEAAWSNTAIDEWLPPEVAGEGEPGIYNGMVSPVATFGLRGIIWYQGESNRGDPDYARKFAGLITGYRDVWGQGNIDFYFAQVAPYRYQGDPFLLPVLWEAQASALTLKNTGMVVTNDIGDLADIHPQNKQEVGRRFALWALARTYLHGSGVYSGPMFQTAKAEGNRVRVSFEFAGTGLASRDGKPLTWFEEAGPDGKFVAARATVDHRDVILEADGVASPESIRFGWRQDALPNLINIEGLPAAPFRAAVAAPAPPKMH